MNDAEQIERITRYESRMQEAEELLQSEDDSAEAISRLWCLAQELDAYYTSDEWKQDYVDDEAGLLPQDLKRGVLSEDGLYDLLEQIRDFRIEALLAQPYWVIDILPQQVPENSQGQFFEIERYYLAEPQLSRIKQKHIDFVLKLNCYRDISLDAEASMNPPPEWIAAAIQERHTCILIDDALLVSEPDNTALTIYNPDESLLSLIKSLASGEGLYVWQPEGRRFREAD